MATQRKVRRASPGSARRRARFAPAVGLCPRCNKQSSFDATGHLPITFDGGTAHPANGQPSATFDERATSAGVTDVNRGDARGLQEMVGKEFWRRKTPSWRLSRPCHRRLYRAPRRAPYPCARPYRPFCVARSASPAAPASGRGGSLKLSDEREGRDRRIRRPRYRTL